MDFGYHRCEMKCGLWVCSIGNFIYYTLIKLSVNLYLQRIAGLYDENQELR